MESWLFHVLVLKLGLCSVSSWEMPQSSTIYFFSTIQKELLENSLNPTPANCTTPFFSASFVWIPTSLACEWWTAASTEPARSCCVGPLCFFLACATCYSLLVVFFFSSRRGSEPLLSASQIWRDEFIKPRSSQGFAFVLSQRPFLRQHFHAPQIYLISSVA